MFSSLHEIYCLPNRRIKTWMVYWLCIQLVTHCCHSFHFFTNFMIFVKLEVIVYVKKKRKITIKQNNNKQLLDKVEHDIMN